ncbi:TIGR01244 family sulfur transferase [Altererythrobacter aquiaggeris]|uniref:TIGR01244 family sulfur transferase n=1 Tax=Aestuarierythrobacter aquiaggeris TaxID=1898396 RepID=UPI00301832A0
MFRKLSEDMMASPQITLGDVANAARQGVKLIINNRPDDEEAGQLAGSDIEAAAKAHDIAYRAIPVGHDGFGESQIKAMGDALDGAEGKVLAYCRSGTRSTFLWALARAGQGYDTQELATMASSAGYDLSPISPALDMLAVKAK